jgi:Glutaredoxin.
MDRTLYNALQLKQDAPGCVHRLEGCPFCELVVDRLDDPGLDYESVWVEGRQSNRDAVARFSGRRVLPVVVDERDGLTTAESGRILEFLDTAYADEQAVSTA